MAQKTGRYDWSQFGNPPIPHEHGAWVILYAALIVGFGAAGVFAPALWLLLVLTVTGIFLSREAIGLLIRNRGNENTRFWTVLYLILSLAGGVPLLFLSKLLPLMIIAGLVVALFVLHSILLKIPTHKRLDRSQGGEILGASALALAAPAAYCTVHGALDSHAVILWLGTWLYFTSGILYVKMWLNAAKVKTGWNSSIRWAVSIPCLIFHIILLLILIGVCYRIGSPGAILLSVAFYPALYRGFRGCIVLSNRLPPLMRVGMLESVFAAWFTIIFMISIRLLA